MTIFKCKMCGGTLEIHNNESVATCEYCGTTQTLPKLDNDKKLSLFNRANRLRSNFEFDKAAGIYESIITDEPDEAEAYWGLVLCKYGIEYVDDPLSKKKIPTCHRSSFESVMDDSNFDLTLEYADSNARKVYREEAKVIEEIRKGIIEVSSKEAPFDIFICYKETDNNGNRTIDSVLAQDIYELLTEKGYRTFFARITLEDKLGQEYEPYIFAALNSSKIMLVVGTDYEYYNAVWVKNEWSRFLKLMENDKTKHLIPCYKDIDAYDMPKEFSKLQSQDLGKVGANQDLLRGIEKLITPIEQKSSAISSESIESTIIEKMKTRAYSALAKNDWNTAQRCAKNIQDYDPDNAMYYLINLLVETKCKNEKLLQNYNKKPLESYTNFKKAVENADNTLKKELLEYSEKVKKNVYLARKKKKRIILSITTLCAAVTFAILLKPVIIPYVNYSTAVSLMSDGEYTKAISKFEKKLNYKDSTTKVKECKYQYAITLMNDGNYTEAISKFEEISDYEDSIRKIKECTYQYAITLMNNEKYAEAYNLFGSINNYKDSIEKAESIRVQKNKELLKNIEIGDFITFGKYETKETEWQVLDIKNGKALLISKYAITSKAYDNHIQKYYTWENCSLRTWLNENFLESYFSDIEQSMVCNVTVSADRNPSHSTDPGNATYDKVFLLSFAEANKYFTSDDARLCYSNEASSKSSGWWLRTPGISNYNAVTFVSTNGSISDRGANVDDSLCVRPALWINLN